MAEFEDFFDETILEFLQNDDDEKCVKDNCHETAKSWCIK